MLQNQAIYPPIRIFMTVRREMPERVFLVKRSIAVEALMNHADQVLLRHTAEGVADVFEIP